MVKKKDSKGEKSKTKLPYKNIKNLDWIDIQFIKLSVLFFSFWIVTFMNQRFLIDYRWLWLILAVIFAIKPFYRVWACQ